MENKDIQIGYVYMITCIITNNIYIGSTKDLKERFTTYAKVRCYGQDKIFNSIKKYGINNHLFEIVWFGDINEMLKYEALIGLAFDVLNPITGLNLRLPSLGDKYITMSQETKDKISKSNKGKTVSKETKLKISKTRISRNIKPSSNNLASLRKAVEKPILQYDLNGMFIKKYKSITEAANKLKILNQNIGVALKTPFRSSNGFYWRYFKENFTLILDESTLKKKRISPLRKGVVLLDSKNNILQSFVSVEECSKKLNLQRLSVRKICSNKIKNPKYNLKFK